MIQCFWYFLRIFLSCLTTRVNSMRIALKMLYFWFWLWGLHASIRTNRIKIVKEVVHVTSRNTIKHACCKCSVGCIPVMWLLCDFVFVVNRNAAFLVLFAYYLRMLSVVTKNNWRIKILEIHLKHHELVTHVLFYF